MKNGSRMAAMILAIIAGVGVSANAQTVLTGHYQPLFGSGLKSGILPQREGFIVQNATMFYHATEFRDNNGDPVSGIDELNIWANRTAVLWEPGVRLLGADYATAVIIPFANLAPNAVVVDGRTLDTGVGLSDIAFAPLMLGWHWTDWHVQSGYTFFAPTGRFNPGSRKPTRMPSWWGLGDKVVYERCLNGMHANKPHQMMSVTKSIAGLFGLMTVEDGLLKEHDKVVESIPELKPSTTFGDATFGHVLDMINALGNALSTSLK